MNPAETILYEFGPFRLHTGDRRLLREGEALTLPPKATEALLLLVANRGRVVEKQEFMRALWPDVTVAESNLTQTIYLLRKALESGAGAGRYIENISKRGYRFVAQVREVRGAVQAPPGAAPPPGAPPVRSIAILPFRPLSDQAGEFEYLGSGLAGALIRRLGRLGQLRVRPASAVGGFAGGAQTAVEAGRRLRVQTVFEGGYSLSEGRLRVAAQLVRVPDGEQLWAGRFEEEFTNIRSLEELLAEKIAIALELRLTAGERRLLAKSQGASADAYQEYMKGEYYRLRHTAEGFEKALFHLRRAIEINPGYGPAYAGLAACYELLHIYGVVPPAQVVGEVRANLDRALSQEDGAGEAYKTLASVKMFHDWEWAEAEEAVRRAIEFNPNDAEALAVYNELLMAQARFGESLTRIEQALEIDPLSPLLAVARGRLYYYERRFDKAVDSLSRLDETVRDFPGVLLTLGNIYESQGEYYRATSVLMKAVGANDVARPWAMAGLGRIYGLTGMRGEALKVIDELQGMAAERYVTPYIMAIIFDACDERDEAFRWLERAYLEHSPQLIQMKVDPRLDRLRSDDRYAKLLRRVALQRSI